MGREEEGGGREEVWERWKERERGEGRECIDQEEGNYISTIIPHQDM